MICKNCGEKVNEKFEYCPYCGEFLDKSSYEEEDTLYTIYPTCDILKELVPDLKTILILALLTFMNFYFQDFLLMNEYYKPNYIFYLYFIVFIWYDMKAMTKKLRFQKVEYQFYKDHLEYHETFGRHIHHSVRYSTISDVAVHQTFVEQLFQRGTIALYSGNAQERGIYIHDIKNVEQAYTSIKEIIERYTNY